MNVLTERVAITKASQLVVGGFYEVRGTDHQGFPIPPQVIEIKTLPTSHSAQGVPSMKVDMMVKLGKSLHIIKDMTFDLWVVNIKDGKGITTGHGYHDRELVLIAEIADLRRILGDEGYVDIMKQFKDITDVKSKYGDKDYGRFR